MMILYAFAFGAGLALTWHRRYWICHMLGAARYWVVCPEQADRFCRDLYAQVKSLGTSHPDFYWRYVVARELGYEANPRSQIDPPRTSTKRGSHV